MVEILNGGVHLQVQKEMSLWAVCVNKRNKELVLLVFPIVHELQLGGLIWWLLQLYSLAKT